MKNIEILSPVGNYDSLIAAVQNGADAVYFGAKLFNARASASNFDDDELKRTIEYAKMRGVRTYLTLNTLLKNTELADALDVVNTAYSFGIDAIIIQDIGLATRIHKYFPDLDMHASTQMAIHNLAGVKELEKLGFKRVVLARELSFDQIEYIAQNTTMEIECFVHGALCMSYSGQCLFSSMVGQRSGNRGKCAGPCRLPYTLKKDNDEIKYGYLLSTKDLCTIEHLQKFKDIGVCSLKIEGRLKQPEYVGLVTKLYKNAVNGNTVTKENIHDLLQMFNRGNFTTGYLLNKQDISFPSKPKNLGIKIGTITSIDRTHSRITITLLDNIYMGDGIETMNSEISTVISEILLKHDHVKKAEAGNTIELGRVKGNISVGMDLYRTSSKELNSSIKETFSRSYRKMELPIKIVINKNSQITVNVNNEFDFVSDVIPEASIKSPLTIDTIKKQFNKTDEIPFTFTNFDISLEDNLFLPVSILNKVRTQCLEEYYKFKYSTILRERIDQNIYIKELKELDGTNSNYYPTKKIYIYLNQLPENIESIQKVDGIYLPYRLLFEEKNKEIINTLCEKQYIYIAIPNIIKDLENIEFNFPQKIKGLLLSNISQFEMFDITKYDIHFEYTGNTFNNITYNYYINHGASQVCISPEMNEVDINNLPTENSQVICYGRIKCMTVQNCVVKDCKNCPNYNYSLLDRMNFEFPIITDKVNCTMNIYNSKILSYLPSKFHSQNIRLDFTKEAINEIKETISMFKTNNNPEGDSYTNGNYKKEV